MLKPYQMYEKEIRKEFYKDLYNPDLKYFFNKGYRSLPNITNLNGRYYAVVEERCDRILGYTNYYMGDRDSTITNVNVVWFHHVDRPLTRGSEFLRSSEIINNISYMFTNAIMQFGVTDIFFSAVNGGPMAYIFDSVVKKFEGTRAGVLHNRVRLEDGKLYDKIYYEIHLTEEQKRLYDSLS